MTKLQLGVIGTSNISNVFVQAALETEQYELRAVYSRTLNKAESFGEPYHSKEAIDDFAAFVSHEAIDVIYIASPNSLHYEQSIQALKNGKHVIVEKPAFTNPDQWEEASKIAEEKGLVLVEAARHIHEDNFKKVKEEISQLNEIQGATLTYMKYSSRYDLVLEGQEPNIFSPKFAGGALMDLGIYTLYAAVSWFGEPEEAHYFAQKVRTGVDGKGTAVLRYNDFDVTLLFGKIATSSLPTEIYSLEKTLRLNAVVGIEKLEEINAKNSTVKEVAIHPAAENTLYEEARVFAEVINHLEEPEAKEKLAEWTALAKAVNRTLYKLRKSADLSFNDGY
ncbi:Gfo/Idh/MocA family protein [Marinilactibacillus psychrotolerans]|uniref:Oxidoreductase n=1 Tax=Marinilactibacillus psychrotolerans TaxID=191770 RepID=A0AAV3WRL9_9LACT|nr:Gfo/Idh/MocA family oxidoreductase [Marinilactibacillus psychrotolerans]GEL67882.1 oxidoreductase [Marinilactibacillus psychrotolerans]GEQ36604.1 oxidoreductase [Marinilactibacillus psychrotolerans]SDD10247.1 Predicted dehydrogenase [Marinilactibacillus psychrotolerans]